MKKMRLLVGVLGVLLIGGIIGSGDWTLTTSAPETAKFVDSVVAISHTENTTLSTEKYVSPIIPQSAKPVKSFYRYKKERLADFSNGVRFSFSVDFPESSVPYANEIRWWLGKKAIDTLASDESYQRKIINDNQLEKYVSGLYFSSKKGEYCKLGKDHPVTEFFELNLQSVKYSSRYVTYQELTHEYGGGAHGYYTERFISYDYVHKREIDYDYLFREGSKADVANILFEEAEKTSKYKDWHPGLRSEIIVKDSKGHPTGNFKLPQPGLSKKGVVFSFQPYSISCFAAGVFHFTIPYERLTPYLTERAKWCLKLKK